MWFNNTIMNILVPSKAYGKFTVTIVTDPRIKDNYNRAALVHGGPRGQFLVPLDILPLAAGKDAWMRDIEIPCADCGGLIEALDTEVQLCPCCYEKALNENE